MKRNTWVGVQAADMERAVALVAVAKAKHLRVPLDYDSQRAPSPHWMLALAVQLGLREIEASLERTGLLPAYEIVS